MFVLTIASMFKLFGLLKGMEVALFNKAVEEGVSEKLGLGSFLSSIKPQPSLL